MTELHIRFVEARDLKDVETFGKQDPYCIAILGKQTYKTKVHESGGKTPKWDEKFVFNVENAQKEQIHIGIFDKNMMDSEKIGEVYLPLTLFMNGLLVDQWFPVTRETKIHGEIHLRLQLVGPSVGSPTNGTIPGAQSVYPPQGSPSVYPQQPLQQPSIQIQITPPQYTPQMVHQMAPQYPTMQPVTPQYIMPNQQPYMQPMQPQYASPVIMQPQYSPQPMPMQTSQYGVIPGQVVPQYASPMLGCASVSPMQQGYPGMQPNVQQGYPGMQPNVVYVQR